MSTADDLDDFEAWLAMQAADKNATKGISQQKQKEPIEEEDKENADDDSVASDLELGEFKDPTQMTLEQLEQAQKIYLRRLEREDLEEGECLEQEDNAAAQKEDNSRSQTRRQDLDVLRAVNSRSTALQRLQHERMQKLAKKSYGGEQYLNDRVDKWLDDSRRDRGKLSKKDKRLQEVAKVRLRASDIYSDNSSDSSASSEAEYPEESQRSKSISVGPTLLSTLDELQGIVLTRSQLIDFVDKPIFEQTVIDCFIQMFSKKFQLKVYQITGLVQSGKTYQLGKKSTDYVLRLRHGRLESSARLDAVSDYPVEPLTFQNWLDSCQRDNCSLPQLSLLSKKQQDIQKVANYQFTEEDVAAIVKKKRESGQRKEKTAVLKIRMIEQRDLALTNNDQEEVARLESEIEEIDRDQDKSRYGQQGVRFGGAKRSGLTPFVPKIVMPKSQHRREAALVPALPRRLKPTTRRRPTIVAPQPIQINPLFDMERDLPRPEADDEPYIPRFLKFADKAKAAARPGLPPAVALRTKLLPIKRSIMESEPKSEAAELERYMKRKYKKSALGKRNREEVTAQAEVPEVVAPQESQKKPASTLYELHDFQVDMDTAALGQFDEMLFDKRPAVEPKAAEESEIQDDKI